MRDKLTSKEIPKRLKELLQKAADKTSKGMDGSGRDRDHAAALRVTDRDLRVLDTEEYEDDEGHRDEESGVDSDLTVEDSRRVVDGCPDVGKDDRPAEKRAESASRPRNLRFHFAGPFGVVRSAEPATG